MRTVQCGMQVLILALVLTARLAAAEPPQPVSPVGESSACPTFSWAVSPGASGYELVVYEVTVDGDVSPHPVTSIDLPAGASSWTLPADSCLAPGGRYAWSLRASGEVGSAWSEAVLFAITEAPSQDEVRHALEVLRCYQSSNAVVGGKQPTIETTSVSESRVEDGPLMADTVGLEPSPQVVTAPASFSLALDGDVSLGGSVFKGGVPFVHNYGTHNTALGIEALAVNTGAYNTAFGSQALAANTSGVLNTAVGGDALRANETGDANVAVGLVALTDNTSGNNNTAVGRGALGENTTGGGNVAIGSGALVVNTVGFNNTAIGSAAGNNTTGSGNVLINSYGVAGESHVLRIGTATGTDDRDLDKAFISGIFGRIVTSGFEVLVGSDDQLGTLTSSARFKQDIAEVGAESERLFQLRPVSFRYKDEYAKGRANPIEYGLLAEEVAEIFPELVINDEKGRPFTVRYRLLAPLLLSEIQSQEEELKRRAEEAADLRSQIVDLRSRVDKLARKRRFR